MLNIVKNKNFWFMLLGDTMLVAGAYWLSYLIRFDWKIPAETFRIMAETILWVVPMKVLIFSWFKLYRGMWRYTSLVDFINVVRVVIASTVAIVLMVLFFYRFQGFPRSVFIIDFLLTLIFIAGVRLAIRIYLSPNQSGLFSEFGNKRGKGRGRRLLLIGAGTTGEQVLREIYNNPNIRLTPVGFLDDDPAKLSHEIHGVMVIGRVDQMEQVFVDYDELLICAPSATTVQMRRIVGFCEKTGKPFKTMPPLGEIIDGRVSLKMIREVSMSDIIGREEVRLEEDEIRKYILGKRVLVTGAGGSIGSELVRQVERFKPQAIALLDMSEYNLYQVERECRGRAKEHDVAAYLVDIGDLLPTRWIFENFRPDVVFHAAAYKHVPMQELNPWETVFNNLLGMKNVIACSIDVGVDKFVMVSTDKAVRPTNVMGATKRVCELMAICANEDDGPGEKANAAVRQPAAGEARQVDEKAVLAAGGGRRTHFMAVRFGNVIGSSGSVIPIFQEQIARGGPVTVTHPDITRFFMSIPEAAQLILQAGAMGKGREIYILKMGEPVRILDLARDVIKFNGLEPDHDIEIVFTGLRPGEKLYEELTTEGEGIVPSRHEKIMVLLASNGIDPKRLACQLDDIFRIADTFDAPAIRAKLHEIVPEYTPIDDAFFS